MSKITKRIAPTAPHPNMRLLLSIGIGLIAFVTLWSAPVTIAIAR